MTQINCLRCKQPIDISLEQCPACGERVTVFQRTYSSKLLDGKYQILDRLGIGGMGEIFKVRHIHLNELRVIKIMRPNVAADDQGMQRFLQEARTSTMIKHKNLAMLYDFAQLDDGSYYMVWEFIDGTNIQKWIGQNGAMPARLAIEISIQALSGLDHLHSMGLIHRDISPENIMLSQDHHGKLLVKVIDFGIAKQLAEGEGSQGLTQTGMFLGKLKYASPEQAGFLKEGEHLDPRSDLYSFGIVMYEMLAGRAPFQATNPHGYILKHVTEKPLPIHDLNPAVKVPPQVESVIMKSLEKSRDNRFATAADFEHALEAIRNTVPPDQKYGLGERMITLSGAQTLAELPKFTASGPNATYSGGQQATQQTMTGQATQAETSMPPPRTGPTGTKIGSDEATVMERNLGPTGTMPGPQPTRAGSDEATMMERLASTAAPTAAEQKWSGPNAAEATMIERQISPSSFAPKKSNTGMMLGIAAALVIVLGGGYFFWKSKQPSAIVAPTSTAVVTATAPTSTAPIPAGKGVLLLSASPWGELDKIVDDKGKSIDITDDDKSTPTSIQLDPGKYTVTMSDTKGKSQTMSVTVEAGQHVKKRFDFDPVNFDELQKEVQKP
ncbi:MAG: eukaryotic-like serine/threonine-protein kinase [Thermoanaerobaculia bacterium]|jgi:serine/threonine-protein kinase|nr:eukaryotic-like serine/threonine-protein kinase [Thermoanaerobaculia bacterium]